MNNLSIKKDRLRAILFLCLIAIFCFSCVKPITVPDEDRRIVHEKSDVIVIVHSHTGHTADLGKEIALAIDADFLWLKTKQERGGILVVEPATIDLSEYSVIFFGSPIWYGTETKFINAFIDAVDLTDKCVVLFNSYGGHLREDFPGIWMDRIVKKGGRILDHIAVARMGRTQEEIDVETKGLIANRKDRWLSAVKQMESGSSKETDPE